MEKLPYLLLGSGGGVGGSGDTVASFPLTWHKAALQNKMVIYIYILDLMSYTCSRLLIV